MSAKQAIGNFLIANEEALDVIKKEKGVQMVPADAAAWDKVVTEFRKGDRERNISTAKGFGVGNAADLIDDYEKTIEKWRGRSKDIGRDIDKFTAVLMSEVFSKIDLDKL
jgi:hypothetical protein